jgi:hypothetical protein
VNPSFARSKTRHLLEIGGRDCAASAEILEKVFFNRVSQIHSTAILEAKN